jgi:hypothetical protein
MNPEKLSVTQLQSALVKWARLSAKNAGPFLYYLREKLRKPGSRTGEGFAAWVAKYLPISSKTAGRWADDYAVSQGLKKPKTSGQKSRGSVPAAKDRPAGFTFTSGWLTEDRRQEWNDAVDQLEEDEVQEIVFNAVTEAAAKRKPKARSAAAGA